jgi:hypothetical protein
MKTNLIKTGILFSFFTVGILSANAQVNNPMYKKDTANKHLWKDTTHVKPPMPKDSMHMKNDTPPKGVVPPHHTDILWSTPISAKNEE